MSNIFEGLENFGLKDIEVQDVLQEGASKKEAQAEGQEQKKEISEEDLIFDKSYTCPVCDNEFKSKMVRTGKVRLAGADSDLRPRYIGVDSLKYDAVLCPKCGYAALNRYFSFIMSGQAKSIREKISANFSYKAEEGKTYSYDDAIGKHKMALLNTVVKNGKSSERAYTCLKLAWLYRGKREQLMQGEYQKEEIAKMAEEEQELLAKAYEGFEAAFGKEDFPMCGMDQHTMMYLLAELARRIGKEEDAKRYVSKVLVARDAPQRIKNKAIDLKEKLQKK
ncbi:MAG: DUF2225 domain-containing protein [Lachnospiraceae bacterium]|nr:DUF2225 domain-containing protein [Lachnospiraceae bacterium]